MNNVFSLRPMRQQQVKDEAAATPRKRGRPPKGDVAMSAAERVRRARARKKAAQAAEKPFSRVVEGLESGPFAGLMRLLESMTADSGKVFEMRFGDYVVCATMHHCPVRPPA